MAQLPDFFGLDLGHNSFKMIDLKLKNNKAELENLHVAKAQELDWNNMDASTIKKVSEILSSEIKKSKIKAKNCVLSLPESSVFSRLIRLPKVKDDEVSESIQWAIKPLIPVDINDVNISFLEIDTVNEDKQEFINWYVVAAPKKLVEKIVDTIEGAGLRLLAIETEALAITRSVYFNHSPKSDVIIIDFGAKSTNVILSRNGVVMFAQTINTGSDDLTKVIASDYGIDIEIAEKYKNSFGIDKTLGEGKIASSIEPVMNVMISEISRALTYFRERISDKPANEIYLTGGGASLPGLESYVTSKIGLQAKLVNPFLNIDLKNKKLENMNINSFSVAVGLALKTS
ncbi:MAG: pilus assembly protein PilM [Candidatus Dojkabacteria bacterium]|nr:MAG: pilus assembly protein PilM [Candidatus Dojkabacteria bacterium]